MIKRFAMVAATLTLGIAGTGIAATQAWASNATTNGCLRVFVNYETVDAQWRKVWYVESQNICGNWPGHFKTNGINGPDTNPVQTHRVNLGGVNVLRGSKSYCGEAWRNDGGGNFYNLGSTCTNVT
ncbi:hypothetical protein ACFCV3_34085 [Kribbella sp. NPDC056345]|uniref:hypothetical protein n=1 Tax=Kribbella sp. NPDC056345 TaxID=3345789 RepID=UPI0035DF7E2E